MKRVQLFEFEDFHWFPTWMRNTMTQMIVVLQQKMGLKDVLVDVLKNLRKEHQFDQLVDLGSGSGGILMRVVQEINSTSTNPVSLTLTDLHPNKGITELIKTANLPNIDYLEESVNACELDATPSGMKTMMNSFHHMPPKIAKEILRSAYKSKTPIFIYEMAENKMPLILWWVLLPISLCIVFIMALFLVPVTRPLTFKHLFFTYIIPLIPVFYAWDGQASMPRMYSFKDIEEMVSDIQSDDYLWRIETVTNNKGKSKGYSIVGLPK